MQTAYLSSPAPAQQPVRVRLSCDSCSAAKVKCDRRRPACERCSSNQLHCTYSVSRRHGCKRRIAYEPAVTAHGAANIAQQSSKGGGYSSTADTKRQARDTADILTYNNNEVSGSSTGNDGITFHNRNDYWNSFQYLADDDFTTGVEVDDSEFSSDALRFVSKYIFPPQPARTWTGSMDANCNSFDNIDRWRRSQNVRTQCRTTCCFRGQWRRL